MRETETGSLSDDPGTCSPSSSGGSSQFINENGILIRKKGICKWFNVAKGWGFITPHDGTQEVFVHQSVIQMTGFRSLGDNEEVEFEFKVSDKGLEATVVTGPDGNECVGSNRRPSSKKKAKKIRCFNCGDLAYHIAARCPIPGPMPKRCHNCKALEHLIAECPKRSEKTKNNNNITMVNGNNNGPPPSSLDSMSGTPISDECTSGSEMDSSNSTAGGSIP